MGYKITYSVTEQNMEEIDSHYEQAVLEALNKKGITFKIPLDGKEVQTAQIIQNFNPADTRLLLSEHYTTPLQKIDSIMKCAFEAQKHWKKATNRAELLRKAADIFVKRQFEFSAIMSLEVGKNRLEALGEAQESIDMIHYYVTQFEENNGYDQKMNSLTSGEVTRSILKPYGIFVVIEPFNFPLALAVGAITAALIAGNSVVFKIASSTPWSAQNLWECFRDAGLPDGVIQLVQGQGHEIGQALINHPLTSGVVFTGSYEVGTQLQRTFGTGGAWAKPCITEMGGKNPGIVCPSADLDKAVVATWKSGFGMTGQKCSELSRIIVHESIACEFKEKLLNQVSKLKIGDPTKKETFIGPVINQAAVARYHQSIKEAKDHAGKILIGGGDLQKERPDLANGHFVFPTIIEMEHQHPLSRKELFLPILGFYTFKTIEQALVMANDTPYGLTAGIFTQDQRELEFFFENIEAGCTYANRPTGITTGAWPGVNTFCGWKGSGGSGKGFLGPYYVAQFMREQSQTRHPF